MSELNKKHDNRTTIRWKLLVGTSALALTAYASTAGLARAEDNDRPQVWIELGGQLSRLDDGQEAFSPVFPNSPARPSIFSPSSKFERPPLFSIDESGKISFQPENSDWIFSASIRYGRSGSKGDKRQQTNPQSAVTKITTAYGTYHKYLNSAPVANRFADTNAQTSERHSILDFQAGKDVGLGMFGVMDGSSVLSAGVRFAQFSSKSNIALKSDPDWHFQYKYVTRFIPFIPRFKLATAQPYHSNAANLTAQRSFRGVGPSISWNASAPLAGNPQDSELTFDWGVNAALLFGKQKKRIQHQTTSSEHCYGYGCFGQRNGAVYTSGSDVRTSKSITVPNVGGFAGLSYVYSDAKISFGYRADMFFGAMDGGIDTQKSENRGFYGPFASISVGLGD